jgi:uncharacterized membrane protein (DUF485 family)
MYLRDIPITTLVLNTTNSSITNTTLEQNSDNIETLIGICIGLPLIMIMIVLCMIYIERNRKNCI